MRATPITLTVSGFATMLLASCLSPTRTVADQAPLLGDTLSASDWEFAHDVPPWPDICGSGARGDTLGHVARAVSWDLDFGDYRRAGRMLRYLWRRGCDPALISPLDVPTVITCLTGDWPAWRAVAIESASWRRPPRLRREILAAADSALRGRPLRRCG